MLYEVMDERAETLLFPVGTCSYPLHRYPNEMPTTTQKQYFSKRSQNVTMGKPWLIGLVALPPRCLVAKKKSPDQTQFVPTRNAWHGLAAFARPWPISTGFISGQSAQKVLRILRKRPSVA